MFLFPILTVAKSRLTFSWPGTEASDLQPFLTGSKKGKRIRKSDLSRGRHWPAGGGGGVQWASASPDSPRSSTFPWGTLSFPPHSVPPPRKGQQSFLPSSKKHIYLGQAHPRWPHNGPYQLWSQAQRPSAHQVSHISCFHPAGQGWAQRGHILTGAKRRQNTPPSPSQPLNHCWTRSSQARRGPPTGGRDRGV